MDRRTGVRLGALLLAVAGHSVGASEYPGKAPWEDAVDVFTDGEAVPGLPFPQYSYGFQIPALVNTEDPSNPGAPGSALLAFAQAYVIQRKGFNVPPPVERPTTLSKHSAKTDPSRGDATASPRERRLSPSKEDGRTHGAALGGVVGATLGDGNDGWIDLVMRRSLDGGATWDKALIVICRNSSLETREYHSCQQPTPVVDHITKKIFLLSSLDNYHMRLQESVDSGATWTPWAEARDLDASLRMPGWGLVFTGLPGGIQLRPPSPHAGRLVLCSSAYWKNGDIGSRYSYTILSDDHGATWRIGSQQIQPRHTTECSVAQDFTGAGEVYLYARIWDDTCVGCQRYGRGIAMSTDGGETWDNATLRGLPNTTPDVEGSITSALVTVKGSSGTPLNTTCFYVSAPDSPKRSNLTVQKSCGGIDKWEPAVVVDPGSSSYSSIGIRHVGTGMPKVYDLWAWSNSTLHSPNDCIFGSHGLVPKVPSQPGSPFLCGGGIRFAEVGFPPCGASYCPPNTSTSGGLPTSPHHARVGKEPSRFGRHAAHGEEQRPRGQQGAPTVKTEQGVATGWTSMGFDVFRGLPYARPPVGNLRLHPPALPLPYPSGTHDATNFGPTCLQDHSWPSEQGANTSSEDCLYLNVYRPSSLLRGSALPVMVYFPAGEFLIGSSNDLENNWPFSTSVILVTINYRLGWLGYAALDELRHFSPTNSTGNLGMQDQRAALQWLGRNIAAFGGDPTRITIFGESSGGSSVGYHLANPRSWGTFHRAIGESPGLTQVRSFADASENTEYLLALLAHNRSAGCEQQDGGPFRRFDQMRIESPPLLQMRRCDIANATQLCAQNPLCFGFTVMDLNQTGNADVTCALVSHGVPANGGVFASNYTTHIKPALRDHGKAEACLLQADAVAMVADGFGTRSGPHTSNLVTDLWAPVVDGVELDGTMLETLANGTLPPNVPVLMGANKDEASTWMHGVPPPLLKCGNTSATALAAWATATFGPEVGTELPRYYSTLDEPLLACGGKTEAVDRNYVAATRMIRDYTITCPIQQVLREAKAAAFHYYFTVTPSFSVNVPNSSLPVIGAFHGAEVPFVFGDSFELDTPGERALSHTMGCLWANFAESGDPNVGSSCPGEGLPLWPRWTLEGGEALVLNSTVRVAQRFASDRCAVLAKATPP